MKFLLHLCKCMLCKVLLGTLFLPPFWDQILFDFLCCVLFNVTKMQDNKGWQQGLMCYLTSIFSGSLSSPLGTCKVWWRVMGPFFHRQKPGRPLVFFVFPYWNRKPIYTQSYHLNMCSTAETVSQKTEFWKWQSGGGNTSYTSIRLLNLNF